MIEDIWKLISGDLFVKGVSIAIFGGFVRVAMQFKGQKIKLYEIFCGVLAASFVGVLIMHIAEYTKMEQALAKILAGTSGFLHTEMIGILKSMHPALRKKLMKILRLEDGKSE